MTDPARFVSEFQPDRRFKIYVNGGLRALSWNVSKEEAEAETRKSLLPWERERAVILAVAVDHTEGS